MAASPPLRDRLLFLQRLPILLKGTADDDAPCPGYVFQEIVNISHESAGSSQCLLEYLLARLQGGSGHVKLKVLKLLLHLSACGSPTFLQLLRRCPAGIQEAAVFAGPPDPLHGNSLYQKVRAAAQDLGTALFSDPESPALPPQPLRAVQRAGMGSQFQPCGGLQGFGYSEERPGSAGEAFLCSVQRAAEVVVHAMRPAPTSPAAPARLLCSGSYQPVLPPAPGAPLAGVVPGVGARALVPAHHPGRAGGGWSEADSSSPSARGESEPSKTSEGGSDSDPADRIEGETLQDCQPEMGLVCAVARGPRSFLSREDTRCFLKDPHCPLLPTLPFSRPRCARLNCEVVLQLLLGCLEDADECVRMRVLSALASLGGSDLLSPEHVLLLAGPRLCELSTSSPGPAATKATKILRHLEASCRQRPPIPGPPSQAAVHEDLGDLLAGTPPFSGDPSSPQLLRPALPSPQSPAPPTPPTLVDARGPESRLASSAEQDPRTVQAALDTVCGQTPGGLSSLFAGMELVSCAHLAGPEWTAGEPQPAPVTQRGPATELPSQEPSVFAFLNV